MKTVMLLYDDNTILGGEKGRIITMYSIEEIEKYPRISEEEIEDCKYIIDNWDKVYYRDVEIAGFVKTNNYTDENPTFIQMYSDEIEIIDML